jgi:Protein of unknown function (DUF2924)
MPKITIGPALPDREPLGIEIARLRALDIKELRSRWHTVLGRPPPSHLPRHLLFQVVAYRLQADRYGDLDDENKRLLDHSQTPEEAVRRALVSTRRRTEVRPGTVFSREWSGQIHRVTVLADGFAWNGKIYPSLSKVAFAITGSRWSGPRFFGLRDKPSKVPVS